MMFRKIAYFFLLFYLLVIIYWPGRHAKHYPYTSNDEVYDILIKEMLDERKPNLNVCDYKEIILENREYDTPNKYAQYDYKKPDLGDSFFWLNLNKNTLFSIFRGFIYARLYTSF